MHLLSAGDICGIISIKKFRLGNNSKSNPEIYCFFNNQISPIRGCTERTLIRRHVNIQRTLFRSNGKTRSFIDSLEQ